MRGFVLQTHPLYESHTSEHLAEELVHAVTEWKLERANIQIPVTTDNAQRIVQLFLQCNIAFASLSSFILTYWNRTVTMAQKPDAYRTVGKLYHCIPSTCQDDPGEDHATALVWELEGLWLSFPREHILVPLIIQFFL